MKELIGAAALIVGIYGGTKAIEVIHNSIKNLHLKKRRKVCRRFRDLSKLSLKTTLTRTWLLKQGL